MVANLFKRGVLVAGTLTNSRVVRIEPALNMSDALIDEVLDILGVAELSPRMDMTLVIHRGEGKVDRVTVMCRVDTLDEVDYYRHGGILPYVLRGMAQAPKAA